MARTRKQTQALELLGSLRGKYIVSQALFYAIREMERFPSEFQERSNIADMKMLRDYVFDLFPAQLAKEPCHGRRD